MTYELKIQTTYLRDESHSKSDINDREHNPVKGVCNNYNARKSGGYPAYIMQHHTVADFKKTIDIFLNKVVSAHYVIGQDGRVEQLVSDEFRAYHAGKGNFLSGSKLNPHSLVKKNDINSWSIGIENVNSGYEPFPDSQIIANVHLMEKLVIDYKLDPKMVVGHSDWTPQRKCDPNPYFPWQKLANAQKLYDIKYNFGVYPEMEVAPESDIIVSHATMRDKFDQNTEDIQRALSEIGYDVEISGKYDKNTRNCVKAFKNHYKSEAVVKSLESEDNFAAYEPYDNHHPFMIQVTENDLKIMGEVADLLG